MSEPPIRSRPRGQPPLLGLAREHVCEGRVLAWNRRAWGLQRPRGAGCFVGASRPRQLEGRGVAAQGPGRAYLGGQPVKSRRAQEAAPGQHRGAETKRCCVGRGELRSDRSAALLGRCNAGHRRYCQGETRSDRSRRRAVQMHSLVLLPALGPPPAGWAVPPTPAPSVGEGQMGDGDGVVGLWEEFLPHPATLYAAPFPRGRN